MIHVGLTGNIASGKSEVARVWADEGVPVLDADRLAREVVEPGSVGLEAVRGAFGEEVIRKDGTLDRSKVREIVFQDAEAKAKLEGILHPLIGRRRADWIAERAREAAPLVVSEIPLLFEGGLEDEFDTIVFVDAPEPERLRRLVRDRGLEDDVARRMMAAQGDPASKLSRSDHVIVNDGSLDDLRGGARKLLARLLAEAGA